MSVSTWSSLLERGDQVNIRLDDLAPEEPRDERRDEDD